MSAPEQLEMTFEVTPTQLARANSAPVFKAAIDAAIAAAPRARPCRCERPLYALDEYDDQRCVRCGREAT